MIRRARSTVVPFDPVKGPGQIERPPAARAALPVLDDARLNAEWDRLVALVMQAWCWRDPESIQAVDGSLQRVRGLVARDWLSRRR